jgi:hypothetical protein
LRNVVSDVLLDQQYTKERERERERESEKEIVAKFYVDAWN